MVASPRIGLIGAGAVGSLLAGSLLSNCVPFQWVVRNPQRRSHLEALHFELEGEQRRLAVPTGTVVPSLTELTDCECLVLVVKAQQVLPLLVDLPLGIPALVVANGLHSGPFHLGVLYGGTVLSPEGTTVICATNTLWAGPLGITDAPAAQEAIVAAALEALRSPWLVTNLVPDIRERMWHKLALNCVVNPLTALLDCPNGGLQTYLSAPLVVGLLREVALLASSELASTARAADLSGLHTDLAALLAGTSLNSSSMREDLHHGRPSEIGSLNCAVADLGARRNLPCPLNQALGSAVLTIEETNRRS